MLKVKQGLWASQEEMHIMESDNNRKLPFCRAFSGAYREAKKNQEVSQFPQGQSSSHSFVPCFKELGPTMQTAP